MNDHNAYTKCFRCREAARIVELVGRERLVDSPNCGERYQHISFIERHTESRLPKRPKQNTKSTTPPKYA
jgi:hypothetical protein